MNQSISLNLWGDGMKITEIEMQVGHTAFNNLTMGQILPIKYKDKAIAKCRVISLIKGVPYSKVRLKVFGENIDWPLCEIFNDPGEYPIRIGGLTSENSWLKCYKFEE